MTTAGIQCGHEETFRGYDSDCFSDPGARGDASWLAVPFMSNLPIDSLVLHQTRDPRQVLLSYLAEGFFRPSAYEAPIWKHIVKRALGIPASGQYRLICLVKATLPGIFQEPTELRRAARFWVEWNSLVGLGAREIGLEYVQYKIEDLNQELLQDLVLRITGKVVDPTRALAITPRDLNSRPRERSFPLHNLGSYQETFVSTASAYGYSLV